MTEEGAPPDSAAGRLTAWIVGGAVLAAGLALVVVGGGDVPPPLGRGSAAPDFALPTLPSSASGGAGRVSLADYRGQILLVNFWATWCKPCEDEMPSMERLYRGLAPEGLALVAISVDDEPEVVERFRERLGISFPIALDPSQEVARLYQTRGFPESLLVDRDGIVVERYVGPREWNIYRERIRALLRGS